MLGQVLGTSRNGFRRRSTLLLIGALLVSCGLSCGPRLDPPTTPAKLPEVRLLLFVAVDQLGWEMLERARPALNGGLERVLEQGVVFERTFHRHANTLTAPGHAALATGLHPRHSGIIGNHWYDRNERGEVYSTEFEGRISPARLTGTTVSDWIRLRDRGSRSFSASGKDRAAVLLGGHRAQAALWFEGETGRFSSSSFYGGADPDLLDGIGAALPTDRFFGRIWRPLQVSLRFADTFQVIEPEEGVFEDDFPHPLGDATVAPDPSFYWDVRSSPLMDLQLAELARWLVAEERLGAEERLDFLGLSFSALDAVGHRYGPHSLEAFDTLLRLDRVLGALLERLDQRLGEGRLMVVVSADHGVAPLPEARQARGRSARREGAREVQCMQRVRRRLQQRFGDEEWFLYPRVLDLELLQAHGLSRAAVERAAAEELSACPAVRRVWTRHELETAAPPLDDANARAYWNAFHPDRSPDLLVQYEPYYVDLQIDRTTHGTGYPYDTHVPLIYWWSGARPQTIDEPVATVDVAPTLATLLGLPRPARLDGRDRSALMLMSDEPSESARGGES